MKSRSIVFPSYKEVNSIHFHYLIGNKMCRELYSRCVPNAKKNRFSSYMYSSIYFFVLWPCWVIHPPRALLWLRWVGALRSRSAQASHRGGFSRCAAQALDKRAPAAAAPGLQSAGSLVVTLGSWAGAELLRGMWDRPGLNQGLNHVSCIGRWILN